MDAIERAVVAPQIKIVEKRAAWRQIFRNRPPLASRAGSVWPIQYSNPPEEAHQSERRSSALNEWCPRQTDP
jgi:hypothetical protein